MNKALNILNSVKTKLNNHQINNGDAFHVLKMNKNIINLTLKFYNQNWIELKRFNDYQMDRLRIAKLNYNVSLMVSITYDFNKIQKVQEYSGRDCSLIDNDRKHPRIISRESLIKLINREIKEIVRPN